MGVRAEDDAVVAVGRLENLHRGHTRQIRVGHRERVNAERERVDSCAAHDITLAEDRAGGYHQAVVARAAIERHAGRECTRMESVVGVAADDRSNAARLGIGSHGQRGGTRGCRAEDFHARDIGQIRIGERVVTGEGKGIRA